MNPAKPDLSVIIVNYKTPQLTKDCIRSVISETKKHSYEIIVVDNDSRDNSQEIILSVFPQIKWIQNTENEGFARANNKGIESAIGNYLLVLNSDTIILDKTIDKCLNFFEQCNDSSIGVVGCKLVNADRTLQCSIHPRKYWPNLKTMLLQNVIIGKAQNYFTRNYFTGDEYAKLHSRITKTDALCGAFLMFKKSLVKKAGAFDPDFFLYFEEIEWMMRVAKRGYKIIFYPFAEVTHLISKSSENNPQINKQRYLSQSLFIMKRYGRIGYGFYLFVFYLNNLMNFLFYPFMSKGTRRKWEQFINDYEPLNIQHILIAFRYSPKVASSTKPLKHKSFC